MGSGTQATIQAFTRFGLGTRPDDIIPSDPPSWLLGQLSGPDPIPTQDLPSTLECLTMLAAFNNSVVGTAARAGTQTAIANLFAAEVQAFLAYAASTRVPFRERLVWFWSNHFAVQAESVGVQATAGCFVRDAIRPHIAGSFADMLVAVVQHPAMLISLNNNVSVGPSSASALAARQRYGALANANINENLGRELLELHTVGVEAGYTQADVDAMAYLLTGFTVNAKAPPLGFVYNPQIAQPGQQMLMGNTYPNTQAGCIAALRWLATQPTTYWRLATKLVTHFVSDTPSAADIQAVYTALATSGGNLGAAATAVVSLPSAWSPLTKLRTPQDLVVAALRAFGAQPAQLQGVAFTTTLAALGQPTWIPPFPNGWSDLAADWSGPEALLTRIDWANTVATAFPSIAPSSVAACALGPLLAPATGASVATAASPHDQLTLLLCSGIPEALT